MLIASDCVCDYIRLHLMCTSCAHCLQFAALFHTCMMFGLIGRLHLTQDLTVTYIITYTRRNDDGGD